MRIMVCKQWMVLTSGLMMAVAGMAQALENTPAGLVDPTQPPAEILSRMPQSGEQGERIPVLTAVKSHGKDSFAIINNSMLRIGDQIQGSRLLSVTPNSATLINNAQQKTELKVGVVDYRKPVQVSPPPNKPAKRKRIAKSPLNPPAAK